MSNVHTFAPSRRSAAAAALRAPSPADVRRQIEAAAQSARDTADRLIALLDQIEGDTDREDGADADIALGAPENHHAAQIIWLRSSSSDAEQDAAR